MSRRPVRSHRVQRERSGRGWYMVGYATGGVAHKGDPAKPGNYSAYVHANSLRHARDICRRRGIGERIVSPYARLRSRPYEPLSALLNSRKAKPLQIVHAAIYLGWLAMRAGKIEANDLLHDEGLIHEIVHDLAPRSGRSRRRHIPAVIELEKRVPGYWPHPR